MGQRPLQAEGLRKAPVWVGALALLGVASSALGASTAGPKRSAANPLAESEKILMQGRADDAITQLHGLIAANPKNDAAHLLLCRAYYAEELADAAVTECEAAMSSLSKDSQAQDWMGRAYGMKADRSGPLAGYKLASKVRAAFEAAVELNPANAAAVNDLGEYYVGAPSILGGGPDKAFELADRVAASLPQYAHRIRGLAAEKEHDWPKAESEFKAAVGVGGHPDAWFDLGHFYYRREQKTQALDALHHALDADKTHDDALVDVASVLVKMKLDVGVAERALRDYLASNAKSDAAPAFQAHVALGKLLESRGDKAGAQAEFQSALALAKDYAPAKKAAQHV